MNKKNLILPLMILGAGMLSSCGDDPVDETNKDNPGIVNPGGDNTGGNSGNTSADNSGDGTGDIASSALAPSDQQALLQQVSKEALSYVSASDFTYWKDLAIHLGNKYIDNKYFDNDVVEDWFEDLVQTTKLGTSQRKEEDRWESTVYTYIYNYTDNKKLFLLANLKGKFTAGVNGWEKANANNLQFIFTDQQGSKCELTLTTSGSSKTVHILDDNNWGKYEYDNNTHTSTEYIDRDKYYVEIPENLEVTLNVGGKTRMKTTVKAELSNISNEVADLSKLKVNAAVTATIDDYTFVTKQAAYTPNNSAVADFAFIKGNVTVFNIVANITGFTASNIGGDFADENTWDDMDDAKLVGGTGYFRFNLLGKLQINGKIGDAGKIVDALKEADDSWNDEKAYKKAIDKINSNCIVGVYYNGKADKNASLYLVPFEEHHWNEVEWDMQPVLAFADGTSYSLLEESSFFNENSFKSLINMFEKLQDDFEELYDEIEDNF